MQKIAQRICRIQLAIGTLFMVCFFIATTIQIAARYLGIVAMWTEEVAVYSFIYAVFMGASIMLYYDEHFKFTGLIDKFPVKMRTSFNMIMTILVMCFTLFFICFGITNRKTILVVPLGCFAIYSHGVYLDVYTCCWLDHEFIFI